MGNSVICRLNKQINYHPNPNHFSSSGEVLKFEKNAADIVAVHMLGEDVNSQGIAVQCTGHNVDHSIHTSDGKDTFHGRGMVAALTPGRTANPIIPRQSISELKYADRNKQG